MKKKKKKQKKMWELHRHFKKWTPEEEDLLREIDEINCPVSFVVMAKMSQLRL